MYMYYTYMHNVHVIHCTLSYIKILQVYDGLRQNCLYMYVWMYTCIECIIYNISFKLSFKLHVNVNVHVHVYLDVQCIIQH